MTMTMGGEVYLAGLSNGLEARAPARAPGCGAHRRPLRHWPEFDTIAQGHGGVDGDIGFKDDNLFIHMTGMSDPSWQKVKDAGAHVSLAVPIEMNMRHGMPPILKTLAMGIEPSLSVDVEVTLTADLFTQMRTAMALQRHSSTRWSWTELGVDWPPPPPGTPDLLTTRDVLRFATLTGRRTCGWITRSAR